MARMDFFFPGNLYSLSGNERNQLSFVQRCLAFLLTCSPRSRSPFSHSDHLGLTAQAIDWPGKS